MSKINEGIKKYPDTEIWMDSCGLEELDFGLARGEVGATSNPTIVFNVIKSELDIWEPVLKKLIKDNPTDNDEDIAWKLIYEVAKIRSEKLMPIFNETNGKKGRLSAQVNAKNYKNANRMLEQALTINSLAKNMQVKIPASHQGILAMEEATYNGISINATVSFTVSQAIAVAEAVERGLERREKEGLSTENISPICTIMVGRVDDWIKEYTLNNNILVEPEALEWAGIAVFKEAYKIFKNRKYKTRLLSAANRNIYHWTEFLGGDISQTINIGWQKKLDSCNFQLKNSMDNPVNEDYINILIENPEFNKAFLEKGLSNEEFDDYGAFKNTIKSFMEGNDELCKLVRKYII